MNEFQKLNRAIRTGTVGQYANLPATDLARILFGPETLDYFARLDAADQQRVATRRANDRARTIRANRAEVQAARASACGRCFATHAGEC